LLTTLVGKRTWFGCGAHVPSVMDSIPKNEWCDCDPKTEKNGTEYPPMGELIVLLMLNELTDVLQVA